MPRFIVADRRDLLGGRLIPILNGLRMARLTGAKFLMTWHTDDTEFQSYVAGLHEIFAGEMVEPYNDATGYGTIIPINHPFVAGPRGIKTLPAPWQSEFWIGDAFVKPTIDGDIFVIDRRWSLYKLREDDTPDSVAAELCVEFQSIPKPDAVAAELAAIDSAPRPPRAYHARRLHLMSDSHMQINRFQCFMDTSFYLSLAKHLGAGVAASDNGAFVESMVNIGCSAITRRNMTPLQTALVEMYEIGRAETIYGCPSAFTIAGSIIGGGSLRNAMHVAGDLSLAGADPTGAIAWHRAQTAGNTESLIPQRDISAVLCAKLGATHIGRVPVGRGMMLRLIRHFDLSAVDDSAWFLLHAKQSAGDDGAIIATLDAIGRILIEHDPDIPVNVPPGSQEMSVVTSVARGDACARRQDFAGAIDHYRAARRCVPTAAGLHMKLGEAFASAGNPDAAIEAVHTAVHLDPTHAPAWAALAKAERNPDAAVNALERAVALEPENGQWWYKLAISLRDTDQSRAQMCLASALRCDPAAARFIAAARW